MTIPSIGVGTSVDTALRSAGRGEEPDGGAGGTATARTRPARLLLGPLPGRRAARRAPAASARSSAARDVPPCSDSTWGAQGRYAFSPRGGSPDRRGVG